MRSRHILQTAFSLLLSFLLASPALSVPATYNLVPSFDGTGNTGFPFGDKPDTGDTPPDCWSTVAIEAGSPTVDLGTTVTEYEGSNGEFFISATGGAIYNNDDSYAGFTCEFTSDATVTVDLTSASKNANSKFGLDLRNNNNPGAEHLFHGIFKRTGAAVEYRGTADGSTSTLSITPPEVTVPECLRFSVDQGVSARAQYADSGPCSSASYTTRSEISDSFIDGTYNINMAVASGIAGVASTAIFDNVTVSTAPVSHSGSQITVPSTIQQNENVTPLALLVTRTGSGAGALNLSLDFVNGTAVAGVDFTTPTCNATIDFADGEVGTKTCNITLIDRSGIQNNRSFTSTLSVVSGTDTVSNSTTIITINETDQGGFPANTPSNPSILTNGYGSPYDWSGEDCDSRPVVVRRITNLNTGSGPGTIIRALTTPIGNNTVFVVSEVGGVIDYIRSPETWQTPNETISTPANEECLIFAPFTSDTPLVTYGLKVLWRTSYSLIWGFDQIKKITNPGKVNEGGLGQAAGDVLTINAGSGPVTRVIVLNSAHAGGSDENFDTWQDVTHLSYDQNVNYWAQGPHAFSALIGSGAESAQAGPFQGIRNVIALNTGRAPLNQMNGTIANWVVYGLWKRGSETGGGIIDGQRFNYIQGIYKKHNTLSDFTRAALVIDVSTHSGARWFFHCDANNRGLNGMPTPPTIDNDASPLVLPSDCSLSGDPIDDAVLYTSVYPDGLNPLDIGSNDTEVAESLTTITTCAGPRATDRQPHIETIINNVRNGTGVRRENDTTAIPKPTVANSSNPLSDMPASPTFENMIEWLEDKNAEKMPAGLNCIGVPTS